jgi:hypothetical protein
MDPDSSESTTPGDGFDTKKESETLETAPEAFPTLPVQVDAMIRQTLNG